jgi:hypothetical protein
MLELETTPTDDPAFVDLAARVFAAAALEAELRKIVVVHVDHWFGRRWLGFRSKLLGAAGVRSARLDSAHSPPPFHPRRVLSARLYRPSDSQPFEFDENVTWLHGYRPSQENLRRRLAPGFLYTWYSGDTKAMDRGVVMVYEIKRTGNAAWYAAFERNPSWRLVQAVGIGPSTVRQYLERPPGEPM